MDAIKRMEKYLLRGQT